MQKLAKSRQSPLRGNPGLEATTGLRLNNQNPSLITQPCRFTSWDWNVRRTGMLC